jgi:probable HAF family extracellular repeat protein
MRVIARFAIGIAAIYYVCRLFAPVHAAGTLVFTALDPPGAISTSAQGINHQGDVVGTFTDTAGQQHGFLRSGGAYRTIDVPNGHASFGRGINDSGDIVGTYQRPGESGGVPAHGFLLTRRGGLFAIDYPGHLNTIPQRILNDGTILGCYHDTDTMGTMHGMMFQHGFSGIDMSMSMNNGATPDSSYMVGLFTDMDGRNKAYVMTAGKMTPLEVPGAIGTNGWDVNPSRVVVGVFTDSAGAIHGWEYDGSSFTRLDAPGATVTRAFGINDRGDVVGAFNDTTGRQHGFVAQAQ